VIATEPPTSPAAAGNAGNRHPSIAIHTMHVTLVLRANIAASAQVSLREYTAMSGRTR
jgi:hypothetical protein